MRTPNLKQLAYLINGRKVYFAIYIDIKTANAEGIGKTYSIFTFSIASKSSADLRGFSSRRLIGHSNKQEDQRQNYPIHVRPHPNPRYFG
jgi:hypothetical protein